MLRNVRRPDHPGDQLWPLVAEVLPPGIWRVAAPAPPGVVRLAALPDGPVGGEAVEQPASSLLGCTASRGSVHDLAGNPRDELVVVEVRIGDVRADDRAAGVLEHAALVVVGFEITAREDEDVR